MKNPRVSTNRLVTSLSIFLSLGLTIISLLGTVIYFHSASVHQANSLMNVLSSLTSKDSSIGYFTVLMFLAVPVLITLIYLITMIVALFKINNKKEEYYNDLVGIKQIKKVIVLCFIYLSFLTFNLSFGEITLIGYVEYGYAILVAIIQFFVYKFIYKQSAIEALSTSFMIISFALALFAINYPLSVLKVQDMITVVKHDFFVGSDKQVISGFDSIYTLTTLCFIFIPAYFGLYSFILVGHLPFTRRMKNEGFIALMIFTIIPLVGGNILLLIMFIKVLEVTSNPLLLVDISSNQYLIALITYIVGTITLLLLTILKKIHVKDLQEKER